MVEDLKRSREGGVLHQWYAMHQRELPWRFTRDPYCIWVSEIILQQTRVDQGLDYYTRFIEHFPTIHALAAAEQSTVLKLWQGLGYYSRARNMHAAAKDVVARFGGIFPSTYEEVLSLRGIGEYTASAIVSFAWGQPYPVVDGNVFRVLGRYFGVDTPIDTAKGKGEYRALAHYMMKGQPPEVHNQAIMEFGALQCVPSNPNCAICPLSEQCVAYAEGKVSCYPVKRKKSKTVNRYFHYFYVVNRGDVYLRERAKKDIWEGLFEFPLIETDRSMDFPELEATSCFRQLFPSDDQLLLSGEVFSVKHVLSHQVIYASFYKVEVNQARGSLGRYLKVPLSVLEEYPVSTLIHGFLSKAI